MSRRYKSIIYLFLGAIISSASPAVIAKLIELGNAHIDNRGENPISFCNVLFAGNVVSFFVLLFIYHKDVRKFRLSHMSLKYWILCLIGSVIGGFLFPTFLFLGIQFTNVVNVVIISTLEIPLTLLVGRVLFREKSNLGILIGSLLTVVGVFVTALLQGYQPHPVIYPPTVPLYYFLDTTPWSGEVCVFLGIAVKVAAIFFGRYTMQRFSPGIYNLFRVSIGAIIFFWLVIPIFGWEHFASLVSPFLWKWMLLYGSVIVALRIYFRAVGLLHAEAAEIAISSSSVPVFAVFFAFLILGEIPGKAQWIGGIITIIGTCIALIFKLLEKEKIVLQEPIGFSGN